LQQHRGSGALTLVEWDETKVAVARALLAERASPSVTFMHTDVRSWRPDREFGAVLLIDVLHYLSREAQLDVLARAAAAVSPGGLLCIRDMDSDRRHMVQLTKFFERVCLRTGITRGDGINPLPLADLSAVLTHQNFKVEVQDSSAGLGFANALIIARKPV
jgi:hypothetical protein